MTTLNVLLFSHKWFLFYDFCMEQSHDMKWRTQYDDDEPNKNSGVALYSTNKQKGEQKSLSPF